MRRVKPRPTLAALKRAYVNAWVAYERVCMAQRSALAEPNRYAVRAGAWQKAKDALACAAADLRTEIAARFVAAERKQK